MNILRSLFSAWKYPYYPPCIPEVDLKNILPRKGLKKLNVLNVGVGEGNSGLAIQLPFFNFNRLDHIDIHQPYLDKAAFRSWATDNVNFINADIRNFGTDIYDYVLMFDIIEHMPKYDGLAVLDKIKCSQIIFIPLEKTFRKNIFGAQSQDHLSIWTEDDFIKMGYKTQVLKNFHPSPEGSFDALWAIKHKTI